MNKLNVLYEDNHIIVVVKPTNILSQSDITKDIDMLSLIKSYLKEKYHKPGNVYLGLVHRLDRVVGGVMVFAKTSKAASRLSNSIRENKFTKNYLAICHGKVNKLGTFVDYLEKKDDYSTIVSDKEHGKLSELSYELIEYDSKNDLSLVKIKLKTGRHHQIRVQFSSRGYPLCGDQRYGDEDKTQIALYAYELSFYHPTTKEKLTFTLLPKGNWWTEFTLSKYV